MLVWIQIALGGTRHIHNCMSTKNSFRENKSREQKSETNKNLIAFDIKKDCRIHNKYKKFKCMSIFLQNHFRIQSSYCIGLWTDASGGNMTTKNCFILCMAAKDLWFTGGFSPNNQTPGWEMIDLFSSHVFDDNPTPKLQVIKLSIPCSKVLRAFG